jgi:hypothetical protein
MPVLWNRKAKHLCALRINTARKCKVVPGVNYHLMGGGDEYSASRSGHFNPGESARFPVSQGRVDFQSQSGRFRDPEEYLARNEN